MPADEFVEAFCVKLQLLRPHSFIAKEQSAFYKKCKDSLVHGEVLVTVDFSENYAFVLQDAARATIGITRKLQYTPLSPISKMVK